MYDNDSLPACSGSTFLGGGEPRIHIILIPAVSEENTLRAYPNATLGGPKLKRQSQCKQLDEIPINSLDPGAIAKLMAGILVNPGVNAFDVHPAEGEVAIGWSVTSNGGGRLRRFCKRRINTTPNAMATTMTVPPTTPPAIAGTFDLREAGEEVAVVNDAEREDEVVEAGIEVVMDEGDVGVEVINS